MRLTLNMCLFPKSMIHFWSWDMWLKGHIPICLAFGVCVMLLWIFVDLKATSATMMFLMVFFQPFGGARPLTLKPRLLILARFRRKKAAPFLCEVRDKPGCPSGFKLDQNLGWTAGEIDPFLLGGWTWRNFFGTFWEGLMLWEAKKSRAVKMKWCGDYLVYENIAWQVWNICCLGPTLTTRRWLCRPFDDEDAHW